MIEHHLLELPNSFPNQEQHIMIPGMPLIHCGLAGKSPDAKVVVALQFPTRAVRWSTLIRPWNTLPRSSAMSCDPNRTPAPPYLKDSPSPPTSRECKGLWLNFDIENEPPCYEDEEYAKPWECTSLLWLLKPCSLPHSQGSGVAEWVLQANWWTLWRCWAAGLTNSSMQFWLYLLMAFGESRTSNTHAPWLTQYWIGRITLTKGSPLLVRNQQTGSSGKAHETDIPCVYTPMWLNYRVLIVCSRH